MRRVSLQRNLPHRIDYIQLRCGCNPIVVNGSVNGSSLELHSYPSRMSHRGDTQLFNSILDPFSFSLDPFSPSQLRRQVSRFS